jgi:hypothetical protein
MIRRSFSVGLLAATLLVACGAPRSAGDNLPPRAEPGLSNAPGLNRSASEGTDHDVISNGLESCPRSGRREDDPLKGRYPKCPESTLTKKPPPPSPRPQPQPK